MNYEKFDVNRTKINLFIIIIFVLVSSVVSFYLGSRYSGFISVKEENLTNTILEIKQQLADQTETITGLNNEINELNEQLSNYDQLEESYSTLLENHDSLLVEYEESRKDYDDLLLELEVFKNQIRGDETSLQTIIGNMSFTLPQRYIIYASGLYESTATMESGILTASTVDDNTFISFSWDSPDSEPNLTATIDNAFNSIGLILEYELNLQMEIGDRNILYSHLKTIVDNEYTYIDVATWYATTNGKQYICIVQNTTDNVTDILEEFLSGFILLS